jgi:hypothetical protein
MTEGQRATRRDQPPGEAPCVAHRDGLRPGVGQEHQILANGTAIHPPMDVKNRLDTVQAAGHLNTLLNVVRAMK